VPSMCPSSPSHGRQMDCPELRGGTNSVAWRHRAASLVSVGGGAPQRPTRRPQSAVDVARRRRLANQPHRIGVGLVGLHYSPALEDSVELAVDSPRGPKIVERRPASAPRARPKSAGSTRSTQRTRARETPAFGLDLYLKQFFEVIARRGPPVFEALGKVLQAARNRTPVVVFGPAGDAMHRVEDLQSALAASDRHSPAVYPRRDGRLVQLYTIVAARVVLQCISAAKKGPEAMESLMHFAEVLFLQFPSQGPAEADTMLAILEAAPFTPEFNVAEPEDDPEPPETPVVQVSRWQLPPAPVAPPLTTPRRPTSAKSLHQPALPRPSSAVGFFQNAEKPAARLSTIRSHASLRSMRTSSFASAAVKRVPPLLKAATKRVLQMSAPDEMALVRGAEVALRGEDMTFAIDRLSVASDALQRLLERTCAVEEQAPDIASLSTQIGGGLRHTLCQAAQRAYVRLEALCLEAGQAEAAQRAGERAARLVVDNYTASDLQAVRANLLLVYGSNALAVLGDGDEDNEVIACPRMQESARSLEKLRQTVSGLGQRSSIGGEVY